MMANEVVVVGNPVTGKDVVFMMFSVLALAFSGYFGRMVWTACRQGLRRPFDHDLWLGLINCAGGALGAWMAWEGFTDPWRQETQRSVAGAHGWSLAMVGGGLVLLILPFFLLSACSVRLRIKLKRRP
jgi:hypothetical protein